MDFIKEWAFSVCCAAIIGGILNMMLPSGSSQKIFKTVLCVFFLCIATAPISEIDFSEFEFDFENNDIINKEYGENDFNKISAEYIENEIIKTTKEVLENENLEPEDINLKINISDSRSIDINEFTLKIKNSENIEGIAEQIKIKTGLTPEITISEDN